MRTTFLFLALAITLRIVLFYARVPLPGFSFTFILLGFIVLLAFLSGHFELGEEPNAPLPALFRVGLRNTVVFALIYAPFVYFFFEFINTTEFPERVNAMVQRAVADGNPEAQIRERLERFFNPGQYAFMTFIGMFSMGAVSALFFAVVHHKLLRKFRQ